MAQVKLNFSLNLPLCISRYGFPLLSITVLHLVFRVAKLDNDD